MKPVIICYHCRKRVSQEEIAAGLHNHYDQRDERALAPAPDSKANG